MGTILIILIVVVLLIIGIFSFRKRITKGCCSPADEENIRKKQIDENLSDYPYTAVVHIEGMHCDNCAEKIRNTYAEKGCLAQVSLGNKEAVVHMKRRLSDEMLTAIPARIGYDADVVKDSC